MISQRRGEKGTKPRPCLPHTASPGAPACPAPAPAPAPSPPRSHGRPPPRTKVPRGTSASGGENQFPCPFRNKPAGEGGTFPQPSFRTEGRQGGAATAGRKDMATPAALTEPSGGRPAGLSSSRWEQAEGAAPGRWLMLAGRAARGSPRHRARAGAPGRGNAHQAGSDQKADSPSCKLFTRTRWKPN